MVIKVIMPQFGESVVEGTLTRWLKKAGERVEQHEALVEVNTDKVDTEVPSPASGVLLEILVPEGITAQAGTVLATIGKPGEVADAPLIDPLPEPDLTTASSSPGRSTSEIQDRQPRMGRHSELGFISPLVARLADEHQVDLSEVQGSGLNGRITKQDVLDHLKQRKAVNGSPPAAPLAESGLPIKEIQPLTAIRRRIAEHMVLSERTAPHVTTVMEADLSRVVAHRLANKESYSPSGVNLTFSAYFVKAAVAGLQAYPLVNSSWHDKGILVHRQINIGMATALDEGLIVPVIRQADALSLLGVARAVNDLAERARSRKLQPEEVQGGTFTITNHGVSGSLFATPIINQPQCAILGVGAIQKRPVVVESEGMDALAIRPMVYLSLTFDHRILDGATADQFLAKVVSILETWETRA
jgi:2-oxoisovalerate dehydrogenase E2 component (dihydrolipoyl transacylase)